MSYPRRNAVTQRFTLGAPRTIIVGRDGRQILFCRSTAGDDPVNRLWVLDLPETEPRLLVDPPELLGGSHVTLSAAERARRERAREGAGGIVTYNTHSDHGAVAFVLGGSLFLTDVASGETAELVTSGAPYDPRLSPDASMIAYCSAGEVRVTDRDGEDRPVIGPGPDESGIAWGVAEFVAAEEMGRNRGHWWGPDGTSLLVTRVDTNPVDVWHISEPVDASRAPRSMPYPAAGTANAVVDLFVVSVDGSHDPIPIDWRGSEFEYLARADWSPNAGIYLSVQPRDQKTLAVLAADSATGAVTELDRWSDPGWVELVGGTPRRFGDHLITVRDDHDADTRRLYVDGQPVTEPGLQVRAVNSVNPTGVMFTATTDSTEQHVHRIGFDGTDLVQLTTEPGVHRAVAGGSTIVITSSTFKDTRSTTTVIAAGGDRFVIETLAERPELDFNVSVMATTERELATALVLPADHDGSPLPVLLDPYGGPHALRVQRARALFSASQWFADQGFAVIVTDGAGTPARGPRFEQQVVANLADPVLDDQVAALDAMAERHGNLLDLGRVGIRGWSFGGYLAALAVLKRPDVFHAAVAGAPVTDWRLYDTHYTERYLGHPDSNPDAYARTDLTPLAAGLTRPLLLIHGLADDNVVAAHTFALSRALLEAGRPHQVLPLSGVSHMTPQESVAENLLKLQVAFLRQALAEPAG